MAKGELVVNSFENRLMIKVVISSVFRYRVLIATALLRLAAWILQARIHISTEESPTDER